MVLKQNNGKWLWVWEGTWHELPNASAPSGFNHYKTFVLITEKCIYELSMNVN